MTPRDDGGGLAPTRLRALRIGAFVASTAMTFAMTACGGGASSTTPNPVPTPAATPIPPITFELDVPADHYQYSRRLAQLVPGTTFEMSFRLQQVNHADVENYAHAISFWLLPGPAVDPASKDGVAFSLQWSTASRWLVTVRTPSSNDYDDTGGRVVIAPGDQQRLRVSRGADGAVDFWFNGARLYTVPGSTASDYVFAEVVGARVEFTYSPLG